MRSGRHVFRLSIFFFLSYGLLYFTYKWVNPSVAESDFFKYYPMILHPLDFHVSQSPWIYRQLSALVAHCIWRLHIYYPLAIQFKDPRFDQRLFFAAIFTNFIGVLIAAVVIAASLDLWLEQKSQRSSDVVPLLAGLLCFFSFFLQETTINGGADGLSWALLAICYFLYKQQRPVLFSAFLTVSIMQREILPIIFIVFAATTLFRSWRQSRTRSRFEVSVIAWSLVVIAGYFAMRHFINTPGMDYQLDKHAQIHAVEVFHFTRPYIMQVFLGQNLLMVLLALWITLYAGYRKVSENMPPLLLTAAALLAISIVTNIGNNAGRILAVLTPILCIEIAQAMVSLETCRQHRLLPPAIKPS